jgi:two-component system OmpR family response regulator
MSRRIAIVEDEPDIRHNYADALRRQGYLVETFGDRPTASRALHARLPDLAILDIGLGDEVDGGFELCRELRHLSPALPIIFLTARDSEIDSVVGLRIGADDYVTKDASLAQLSARVDALLRRAALRASQAIGKAIVDGPLALDSDRLQTRWRERPVALTVTELWILHALVVHPGHVKNRTQLMEAADIYVDAATITSHIKRIRRKFLAVDPTFDAIEAVYGAGYRWIPQN